MSKFQILQDKNSFPFYMVEDVEQSKNLPEGHKSIVRSWLSYSEALVIYTTLTYLAPSSFNRSFPNV